MLGLLKPAISLTDHDIADWVAIQQCDPTYRSPFFRPEFTCAVADVRPDASVLLVRQQDRTVGFFPFMLRGQTLGEPIGGAMNDFHGPVARPSVTGPAREWLQAAGLRAYRFSHLPAAHPCMMVEPAIVEASPFVDLSRGYDSYYQKHLQLSRRELPVARQKLRKAVRELGPMEFTLQSSGKLLNQLIEWKLTQCRLASRYSVLSECWAQQLIHRLMCHRDEGFSAVLSTLSFGGQPAAALFSLRSFDTLHCCITAYDPKFAPYSPGMQLMLQVVQSAASDGVTRLDLGRGTERYKQRLANQMQMVGEGCADLNPLAATLWHANLRLRHRLRTSALWPLIARVRMLAIPGR